MSVVADVLPFRSINEDFDIWQFIDRLAKSIADAISIEKPELLSVDRIANILDISPSHVYRLSDAGEMPAPVKLGNSVRWVRAKIEDWIEAGCKTIRSRKRGT